MKLTTKPTPKAIPPMYQSSTETGIPFVDQWFTNRKTGKKFRPDGDYGYVSERRQRNLPICFRDCRKRQAAKANEMFKPNRAGRRLLIRCKGELVLYTLSAKDLNLPEHLEKPEVIFTKAGTERWFDAIETMYGSAPRYVRLEIGDCGRVHAHVVSRLIAELFLLLKADQRKPIKPGTENRVFKYLHKRIPPTEANIRAYKRAVKKLGDKAHLPQTSGFRHCRLPKPVTFLYREWATKGRKPTKELSTNFVQYESPSEVRPTANRPKIDAELPVILKGSTPYEREVITLFKLLKHRKLFGRRLKMPDGTITPCLEKSLGAYFLDKWVLLPSECKTLFATFNTLKGASI